MKNSILASLSLAVVSSLTLPNNANALSKKKSPNIILILMDDMGYGDLSSYGARGYDTPNIDKLAAEGIRFVNYYSPQAVSSASRAGLLTGCYPNRVGFSGALFPNSKVGINPDETLIPELLKGQHYATGMVGKWHIGDKIDFLPLQHGFESFYGIPYSNDMWVPRFKNLPELPILNGNDKVKEVKTQSDQDELTTDFTEKAIQFIENHKKKPFFLYLAHAMVHTPIGVSDKFRHKSKSGMFGDMMMEVDWSVGQIMNALKRNGIDKNTIIVFTSDNGPWLNFGNHAGSTGGLREGKGTTWEGGQRVPCIIRWPMVISKGKVSNELVSGMDFLPTFAEITGAKLPTQKIDGISMLPILLNREQDFPDDRVFYYYYNNNSLEAVQKGYWKLVFPHKHRSYVGVLPGLDGKEGSYASAEVLQPELYNLGIDQGERVNVISQYPEIAKDLMRLADDMRNDLGDDLVSGKPGPGRRKLGQLK
jgi:arylsulfatase A-like enzyme